MKTIDYCRGGFLPTLNLGCMPRPVLGLLLVLAAAQPALASGDPQHAVTAMNRDMAEVVQQQPGDGGTAARMQRVEEAASRHADFAYTAQLVLGEAWTGATPRQRDEFTGAFRSMLVWTFSEQVLNHAGTTRVIGQPRVAASGRIAEVRAVIAGDSGGELQLRYRLHDDGTGWKLFDLEVDGIGLVAVYTGSIRSRLGRVGLDGVIRELVDQNTRLQDA